MSKIKEAAAYLGRKGGIANTEAQQEARSRNYAKARAAARLAKIAKSRASLAALNRNESSMAPAA